MIARLSLAAALLLCVACAGLSADRPLEKATFLPQWAPQAQFAGYYVAQERGLYRRHGIDLTIARGGPESPPSAALQSGAADFTTLMLSAAVQRRAAGMPLVNIAQVMQKSALMLVARRSSGIASPRDLAGKRVGLWPADFQVQPLALFRNYGVAVTVVPQAYSIDVFLRGQADAVSAMWYNELHEILTSGVPAAELTTIFFHEHGLNFPEDGLYAMESTVRRHPALTCAFVRASIEGWYEAFAAPQQALDIVLRRMQEAGLSPNRAHACSRPTIAASPPPCVTAA
jgi:NitT/TauT family transport system substrate-binding protein